MLIFLPGEERKGKALDGYPEPVFASGFYLSIDRSVDLLILDLKIESLAGLDVAGAGDTKVKRVLVLSLVMSCLR